VELYFYSPNTSSWRGAQLKESTGTILPFTFRSLHDYSEIACVLNGCITVVSLILFYSSPLPVTPFLIYHSSISSYYIHRYITSAVVASTLNILAAGASNLSAFCMVKMLSYLHANI
jgi:hypothetical protein